MSPTFEKTTTSLRFGFVLLLLFGAASHAPIATGQSTGTFTPTRNMTEGRWYHTATLLTNGKVLIAGGHGFNLDPLDTAEIYDPFTGTFAATGSMATARDSHIATLLRDGRVLIAGGEGKGGTALASAEIYDPFTGSFAAIGSMSASHYRATLLSNGKVLMGPPGADGGAELYDPSTGTFTTTGGYTDGSTGSVFFSSVFGIDGQEGSTETLLPDGRVLITSEPTAELYVPASGRFSLTGAMNTRAPFLAGRTATLLTNGKVLVTGGDFAFDGNTDTVFASAELYDPSTGTFTVTGDMTTAREMHTATLLPDGSVLITGDGSTADLYDPASGTFSPTGPMNRFRFGNTATLLGNGTVLIAGGQSFSNSAEVYDPPSSVWQQAITAMKTTAGTDSLNFWQWAWYWQRSPAFAGAPAGFGVQGSIDNTAGLIEEIIAAGGGNGSQVVSAEQWVLDYRSSSAVVSGIVNAASHLAGAIAPGELVVVTGSGLGPTQVVFAVPDGSGRYATQLAGTTVLVNGTPVPVIYTSATQVEAVIPDSLVGNTAQVTVTYQGQTSASFATPVAPAAPGIFTADSTGQGHALSINQNGLINIPAHWEGDVITLFVTGTGQAVSAVTIHGFNLGVMPLSVEKGTFPGVTQIKVPIPRGQDCDTQVVVQVGNAMSQPGVSIAVDLCI